MNSLLGSSDLIRQLSHFSSSQGQVTHENFTERLSQMIDFAGSVKLSDAQGVVRMIARKGEQTDALLPESFAAETARKAHASFLRVQHGAVQSIQTSFDADTSGRIKLPLFDLESFESQRSLETVDLSQFFEPYRKFYLSHQVDISAKTQGLRVHTRELMLLGSSSLAQLAELDKALDEVLSAGIKQSFQSIPKLLKQRFEYMFQVYLASENEPTKAIQRARLNELDKIAEGFNPLEGADQRFTHFCTEMKELLLAELEVRLLPVLGLLAAVNEEVSEKV
jgi:hypothetical protein